MNIKKTYQGDTLVEYHGDRTALSLRTGQTQQETVLLSVDGHCIRLDDEAVEELIRQLQSWRETRRWAGGR